MNTSTEDFGAYKKLLLHRLEEQKEELIAIKHELHHLTVDVAALKVKAGMWGMVGGLLPATLIIISRLL